MKTVAFCEINMIPQIVLNTHWPEVPVYADVRDIKNFSDIDVICGGFPCTDLSQSSKGSHKGFDGEHSGLVYEYGRIVKESQPAYIIIENVPQIKKYKKELQEIFADYELSYNDTDATDYGALCRRNRTFIIGHSRARGGHQILIEPTVNRQVREDGGKLDKLPMLLPWKGGVSLERLASCVVSSKETDTIRVREGIRLPYVVGDGVLYLMLGNSLCPAIPEAIGKAIIKYEEASS